VKVLFVDESIRAGLHKTATSTWLTKTASYTSITFFLEAVFVQLYCEYTSAKSVSQPPCNYTPCATHMTRLLSQKYSVIQESIEHDKCRGLDSLAAISGPQIFHIRSNDFTKHAAKHTVLN
jgi:hypothetical protein